MPQPTGADRVRLRPELHRGRRHRRPDWGGGGKRDRVSAGAWLAQANSVEQERWTPSAPAFTLNAMKTISCFVALLVTTSVAAAQQRWHYPPAPRAAGLRAAAAPVLDPNTLSPDGSIAVAQWSVSPDGRVLGYTTAVGGSDLQDIHFRDLRTGRDLAETLPRVKYTGIAWTRDGKGFYYSRYRGSAERANLTDATTHHQLFYHALGSAAARLVFERLDDSTAGVNGGVS